MSDVHGTGENLWDAGFHERLFQVFHLWEHEEIVVDMQFLFLVEQAKGVLDSYGNRSKTVEAPKRAFNGVLDEGLTARSKFHQNVVRTFFDAHHFRNTVTHFQDLWKGRCVLHSQRYVQFSIFKHACA